MRQQFFPNIAIDPITGYIYIVFYDRSGSEEISRRNLYECVPCGWTMSDLGSEESGSMTESISLVYEDADWK